MTFFPAHSYEQFYQSVRRCWRYGQKRDVTVDIIMTEGERKVMSNLKRKADAADAMFTKLVECMNEATTVKARKTETREVSLPSWIS
jgi:hypothetical protein